MEDIKFVNLHAHSGVGSPFDGFGYPQEHMDFAYQNGMDALALTDHGNANGLAYQVLHAKKMHSEGKVFKPIYGVEAYFLPSNQIGISSLNILFDPEVVFLFPVITKIHLFS